MNADIIKTPIDNKICRETLSYLREESAEDRYAFNVERFLKIAEEAVAIQSHSSDEGPMAMDFLYQEVWGEEFDKFATKFKETGISNCTGFALYLAYVANQLGVENCLVYYKFNSKHNGKTNNIILKSNRQSNYAVFLVYRDSGGYKGTNNIRVITYPEGGGGPLGTNSFRIFNGTAFNGVSVESVLLFDTNRSNPTPGQNLYLPLEEFEPGTSTIFSRKKLQSIIPSKVDIIKINNK